MVLGDELDDADADTGVLPMVWVPIVMPAAVTSTAPADRVLTSRVLMDSTVRIGGPTASRVPSKNHPRFGTIPPSPAGTEWVIDATRIDQWLWAVRVYKTRSLATAACKGGHVKVEGTTAKPARPVRIGDRVEVRDGDRHRILEVLQLIDRRVAAPIAAECVVDLSPPTPPREYVAPPLFSRDPGTGRPTKKDRRSIDRLRNR